MNITYYRANGQVALRVATVNVVEMSNGEMQGVRAFVDNPEGNKQAEKAFVRLIKEHEKPDPVDTRSTKEDFENFIDEGTYEDNSGYQLFLTHSI